MHKKYVTYSVQHLTHTHTLTQSNLVSSVAISANGLSTSASYSLLTDLILVPGEAAALHGAGVEVALVIELEAGEAGVQLVEDGWQAASQGQQLGAGAVEANAHCALQGHAASVTEQ